MGRVVVFHTSDLHNKLTPELARKLGELKSSEPESLMLDSGDALRAGNIFWLPKEPIIDLMNSVPYDAMCMGNREFHFLRAGMRAKTSRAEFPILSANLAGREVGGCGVALSVVLERAGIKIGVTGVTVPCVTAKMRVGKLADYYFEEPIASAKEVVNELRAKCDVLIVLTHLAKDFDRRLAEGVGGIDLILSGHSHTVMPPEAIERTVILRHGARAEYVGRVTLSVENGRVAVEDELVPLAKA